MHEADLVANTVKTWLGNPVSRSLLRWVSKRNEKGSKLDSALKKYVGITEKLSFQEKLAYLIVKLALDKGSESFGVSKEQMIESLKSPIVRRGIANILEGIGYYGVQRPQTTAAPFLIVWNFTKQCNLKCKHCYENAGPKPAPDELTTEEAKHAIDEFANAGVVALSFSGGEPLARKDFLEVAKYAAEKEFYVSAASNGILITEKVAQKN
jgi:sulfatase maturation enzyme AslB (radical SAM superfamily)